MWISSPSSTGSHSPLCLITSHSPTDTPRPRLVQRKVSQCSGLCPCRSPCLQGAFLAAPTPTSGTPTAGFVQWSVLSLLPVFSTTQGPPPARGHDISSLHPRKPCEDLACSSWSVRMALSLAPTQKFRLELLPLPLALLLTLGPQRMDLLPAPRWLFINLTNANR